jgi:hypothetical protein
MRQALSYRLIAIRGNHGKKIRKSRSSCQKMESIVSSPSGSYDGSSVGDAIPTFVVNSIHAVRKRRRKHTSPIANDAEIGLIRGILRECRLIDQVKTWHYI